MLVAKQVSRFDIGEAQLGSGVGPFRSDDQPHALRPRAQVGHVGDLCYPGAGTLGAARVVGRAPGPPQDLPDFQYGAVCRHFPYSLPVFGGYHEPLIGCFHGFLRQADRHQVARERGRIGGPPRMCGARLLGLNGPEIPYLVSNGTPGEKAGLVVEWRVMKPTWRSFFVRTQVSNSLQIRMGFDPANHVVRR